MRVDLTEVSLRPLSGLPQDMALGPIMDQNQEVTPTDSASETSMKPSSQYNPSPPREEGRSERGMAGPPQMKRVFLGWSRLKQS